MEQIYKHYEGTIDRYKIHFEIADKEVIDIQQRLNAAKEIYNKNIDRNDTLIEKR